MKIVVSGKHMEIGKSLHEYVNEHLEKVVHHFFGRGVDASVTFSKQNSFFQCEVFLHVSSHLTARSHGQNEDPYVSFDEAVQKLRTRLQRHKNKLADHHKREGNGKDVFLKGQRYVLDSQNPEEQKEGFPAIIAEMNEAILTLSVQDAVMQLELSDAQVFMFKNARNDHINVVYRREDGNIGWIDPSTS